MKYAVFYSLQAPPEFGVTPQQSTPKPWNKLRGLMSWVCIKSG